MTAAERAVRVVARTLPGPIRARYREEWLADVAGATEHGMSPASVAVGAAVFAITLDRDLPSVSGFSLPEQSRHHARWALAFTGLAALLGLGRTLISEVGINAIPIAVVFVLAAVVQLWAAARLTSGLGRTAAALGTTGLLIYAAASTIPIVVSDAILGSRHLWTLGMGLLVGAVLLGIIVWVRGVGPWIVACVAAVLGAVALTLGPFAGAVLLAVGVVLVGVILQIRADNNRVSRHSRTVIVASSAALLALLALTILETLVLSPLRMAGGDLPLGSIYSGLPDVAAALGPVVAWTVVELLAVVAYLLLGLRFAPGWGTKHAALLGITLGSSIPLTIGLASFSLVQQLVDSFAVRIGYSYPEPRLGIYLQLFAIALLAISATGWLAPRGTREEAPTAA